MYLEDFPTLQEPIDDTEIEAAVLRVSSASYATSARKRAGEMMREIPIEEVDYVGDAKRGKIRRPEGRLLPNWRSPATSSRTATDGQCWTLLPPSCRQDDLKVNYPPMAFGGKIVYARTTSEVERAASQLMKILQSLKHGAEQIPLGFDIEWRPNFIKGARPKRSAVMQICAGQSHCFVLHIFHSGIPPTLRALLSDSSYVKVGISIAGDAAKISGDYSVEVSPLEDLSDFANRKLGAPRKMWGLSSLTETVACKQLAKPKKIRMGNWEAKVLSKEQLHYAATDAFASWFLYEALKNFPESISGTEDGHSLDVVHVKNASA